MAQVTLTTLGYGDMVPITWLGRLGAVMSCMMGIVITSIVVAVLTNLMIPASYQQRAIDYLLRIKAQEAEKHAVVKFMQARGTTHPSAPPSLPGRRGATPRPPSCVFSRRRCGCTR